MLISNLELEPEGMLCGVDGCQGKEKIMEEKKFSELFRNISDDVGVYAENNKEGNPYKKAYDLVKEVVNNDYDNLMQLKAECSLSSYDDILSAGIKVVFAVIAILTFIWDILHDIASCMDPFSGIIYLYMVLLLIIIIVKAHKRYKYVGVGEKYVKLAIDNLIKEYHIKW